MYVINGTEFWKNRNRNSNFRLERFLGVPILFSAGKFRNPELGNGIPNSGRPRNRNPKSEFPTKPSGNIRHNSDLEKVSFSNKITVRVSRGLVIFVMV